MWPTILFGLDFHLVVKTALRGAYADPTSPDHDDAVDILGPDFDPHRYPVDGSHDRENRRSTQR